MTQTNTRAMLQSAFLTAIVVVLLLIGNTVPILNVVAMFAAPAVLGFIGIRWGIRYSIMSGVVALLLLGLVFGLWIISFSALPVLLIGVGLGWAIDKGYSYGWQIVGPALLSLVGTGLTIVIGMAFLNINPIHEMQAMLQEFQGAMLQSYEQSGFTPEQQSALAAQLTQSITFFSQAMVAMFFVASCLMSYIVRGMLNWAMKRFGQGQLESLPLSEWRMPQWGAYVMVVGWIVNYWFSKWALTGWEWVAPNLITLGLFVCTLQGIILFWYVLGLYPLPRAARIGFTVFAYFAMGPGLALLGLVDLLFDLRRRVFDRLRNRR